MTVRVVVLGLGGAGESTFARQLAAATGAAWIGLDNIFWQPGPKPMPVEEWCGLQEEILRRAWDAGDATGV
jgi:adenylate kinase family enzyme